MGNDPDRGRARCRRGDYNDGSDTAIGQQPRRLRERGTHADSDRIAIADRPDGQLGDHCDVAASQDRSIGRCGESYTANSPVDTRSKIGRLDYQHVTLERVQEGFGRITEEEALQSGSGDRAHHYNAAAGLARCLLDCVDGMSAYQVTVRRGYSRR